MTLMAQWRLHNAGAACLLTLLSTLAVPVNPAVAQTPPSAATSGVLPKKIYTKSLSFDLPILMEEATRQALREVCLYVKRPGGGWVKQATVAAAATKFTYQALQDGEYWFNLVTVDKQGRATPADVNAEQPGLRVVVDAKPPVIEIQALPGLQGGCSLRCTVLDDNVDPVSLRAFGHGVVGDTMLEEVPGQPGVFLVHAKMMNHPIRVTASDLAGNTTAREINVKDLLTGANPGAAPAPTGTTEAVSKSMAPHVTAPESVAPQGPALPPQLPTALPPQLPTAPPTAVPPALLPVNAIEKPGSPTVVVAASATIPTAPSPASGTGASTTAPAKMPMLPLDGQAAAGKNAPADRRILNTTHASVDYRIDHVGPSGVGKVDVYVTHDQGTTWRRLGEDTDRQSPAEIDLPGEGLFGIRLAITNGNGFGGTAPVRGDAPQSWVEVDTTPPFVQLRPAEVVPGGGALEVRWSASDPNFGPTPVSIFFRSRADGPWEPLARNLKNDGTYRWAFPRDVAAQIFFKVEVVDRAGNVARAESQAPTTLDVTEPHASVLGITGMNKGAGQ